MALSKFWTLQKVEDLLRDLLGQIAPDKVQSTPIQLYVNLATQDVCEMLNAASQPDYMSTAVLNESDKTPTPVATGATYTNTTKTVNKTTHGLTSSDIGKRIILVEADAADGSLNIVLLTEIVSITNANAFVVRDAMGADSPAGGAAFGYAVFPLTAYSSNKLDCDISASNIDRIVKIVDSVNGLVNPAGDAEIEGITYFSTSLPGNSLKQGNVWYTQNGETVSIYKGTSVSAYGTLTMYFYRQPTLVSATTDYIDVKDKFMPLVIAKAKNLLYEQLQQAPPESISGYIEQKSKEIRAANAEETAALKNRAK